MRMLPLGFLVMTLTACGGAKGPADGSTSEGGSTQAGGTSSTEGAGGAGATSSGTGAIGSGAGASTGSLSSSSSSSGGATLPAAGNPDGSCTTLPLPAEAQAVDTSHPTTVVGTGTAASCTFAALNAAVIKGGIITFDCGEGVVTIPVTATLKPPVSKDGEPAISVVIDGGNKISLDGGKAVQILSWVHNSWRMSTDTLTLQHIQLVNGKTTPTMTYPACPPSGSISNTECSTGFTDGEGGALYMMDGNLRVIDSTFADNQAALIGPDTGGGAIYIFGTAAPCYIVKSTFKNNTASNAGAIGMLGSGAFIFDSLFDGNSAVGNGANSNDATKCTCTFGGNKNQIGSGGNGGAIYKDGQDVNVTVCGSQIQNNTANEFGPAIFLTADGSGAELIIDDTVSKDNVTPIPYWQWCKGVSTDNTSSPQPINSSFCDTTCSTTCG